MADRGISIESKVLRTALGDKGKLLKELPLTLAFLIWSLAAAGQPTPTRYVLSEPVSIDGTAQLRPYTNGGDGSAANPFLIEGLCIDAQSGPYCLAIRNVSDHIVIRDCWFAGASGAALQLENVRNAWVVDTVIKDNSVGVSCTRGTRGVVFAGNTFRNNASDANLSDSSVQWDDGYMGNYWSLYRGHDSNGDGIGDAPYTVRLVTGQAVTVTDRFPLREPIAGEPAVEGCVLLRMAYTAGDSFEVSVSQRLQATSVVLFSRSVVEALAEQRVRSRVLASPGTGLFTLEDVVLEDSGTVRADGVLQPYESSAGTSTIRQVHRLGITTEPGHGMLGAELAGVNITAQLPARRVTVGDRWTALWMMDAAALGWQTGEQRIAAAFLLGSFEVVDGDLCAVLTAEATITSSGSDRHPMLGAVSYHGRGTVNTTAHFSVSKGRIVRQTLSGSLDTTVSMSGFTVGQQRWVLSATAVEGGPRAEARSGTTATPVVPQELLPAFLLLIAGDFPGAEEAARKAAATFRLTRQVEYEATALFVMADAQMRQEKYHEAIGTLEKALPLYRALGLAEDEAACLSSLGFCHRRVGEHTVALGYYERAATLAGDDPETRSIALVNMGICLIATGEYTKAIARLEEARALRVGRDIPGVINTLNFIAICYRKLGRYKKALEHYDEALALCDPTTPPHLKPILLGNKGACYIEQGDLDQGLTLLLEAQKAWAETGIRQGEAGAWVQIAMCQQKQGKAAAAMSSLERALNLSRTTDIAGSASYWRGWCYLDLNDPGRARVEFEKAREWARAGGDLESLWRCDWGLAKSWWRMNDLARAKECFERAVGLVEKARGWLEAEDLRKDYFLPVQGLYQDYLTLLSEMGQREDMLWMAERCRARTFLDLLAQGPMGTLQNVREEGVRTGVVQAETIRTDLWEVIGDVPEDTVVLEYFVTEKALYAWVITRGQVSDPIPIEVDRSVLLERVLAFRRAIETPVPRGQEAVALLAVLGQARDLYDLLLSPVSDRIAGFSHLVIVPSGPLYYLPFAALYACPGCEEPALLGGQYLVDRFTLSYLPSLTTLKYVQFRRVTGTVEPVYVGFGNPDGTLPQACAEVAAIGTLFARKEVYCDQSATEELVHDRSRVASHLLLSTHGVFNPYNPMDSYLVFFPTGQAGKSDGKLSAYEVLGLGLQADLVTLSACETLLSALEAAQRPSPPPEMLERITAGDELVGLTRAFIYAGTPTVLATLWSVYDVSTRHLIVELYGKLLGQGLEKAEALRQAQLLLVRDHVHCHPVHWAAFTLYGDWR